MLVIGASTWEWKISTEERLETEREVPCRRNFNTYVVPVPSWEVPVVWIWRIMSRLLFVVYPNNQKAQANLIFIWSIFLFWKLCPRVSRENAAGNSGHDFWPLQRRRAQHTETSSEPVFEKRKKIWLRFVKVKKIYRLGSWAILYNFLLLEFQNNPRKNDEKIFEI